MPLKTEMQHYPLELVLRAAKLYFEDHVSQDDISKKLEVSRAQVQAMCAAAQKDGWVYTAVLAPAGFEGEHLRNLEEDLKEEFGLQQCRVIHGRDEMLDERLTTGVRESVVDNIVHSAASELDRLLGRIEVPILAVHYGIITRRIEGQLRPRLGLKSRTDVGTVLAAQGGRILKADRFDANSIARDIARQYNYDYKCIPIPAFVGDLKHEMERQLPLVSEVLQALKCANIAVGTVGGLHQSGSKSEWSLQQQLNMPEHMEMINKAGGFATVGGWWFDAEGTPLEYTEKSIAGLTLTKMKKMVSDRQPVMLAVGGDETRLPGLYVALKHKICNVLITDEVSAGVLLARQKLSRKLVAWTDAELQVLNEAKILE